MAKLFISSRRKFLGGAAATGGGLILTACSKSTDNAVKKEDKSMNKDAKEEEVSPAEDLMREHGILKRVLLTYREGMSRIDSKQDLPPEVLNASANLIRRFIEDYHEKLEEEHLFPRSWMFWNNSTRKAAVSRILLSGWRHRAESRKWKTG